MTAFELIDLLADIATIVIALAILLLALVLFIAAWNSRKLAGAVRTLGGRLQDDARPIVQHLTTVADNLSYISASIRDDVEGLKGTIQSTQARLTESAAAVDRRINDFNALLGVVQEEAEDLFIGTASTVRGVRAGADALHRPPAGEWTGETPPTGPAPGGAPVR